MISIWQNLFFYIHTFLQTERRQWTLWVPVFLCTGAGLYFIWPHEPYTLWPLGFLVITLIVLTFAGKYRFYLAPLCLILMGFTLAQWRTHTQTPPLKQPYYGPITGHVDHIAHKRTTHYILKAIQWQRCSPPPKKIRLFARIPLTGINIGDTITGTTQITPLFTPVSPIGYDGRFFDYFNGIGAMGFVNKTFTKTNKAKTSTIAPIRQQIIQRLQSYRQNNGLATALLTGNRDYIPKSLYNAFRTSGLAHLLAISGLHVGLIAACLFFITNRFLLFIPILKHRPALTHVAYGLTLLGTLAYALLAGFTPPTWRAFTMLFMITLGFLTYRQALSLRSLAIAATMMVLLYPELVMSLSFSLSFMAALSLVGCYYNGPNHLYTPVRYLLTLIATSLLVSISTAPLILYTFHTYPTYGVLSNLVAIPLTAFVIMPLALLSLCLMPIGLDTLTLPPLFLALDLLATYSHYITHLPFPSLTTPPLSYSGLILYFIGFFWWLLWRSRGKYILAVPLCALGFALLFTENKPIFLYHNDLKGYYNHHTHTLTLNSKKKERFARYIWQQQLSYPKIIYKPNLIIPPCQYTTQWIYKKYTKTPTDNRLWC